MTNMTAIPYTPRHSRTNSPPLSVSSPSTLGPQTQRLNIVTRLAVEGNAKKAENVPIKMYMKLALPVDNIVPGSAIPLFKEENVKILESEVHPLDPSSVPYNFSSTASPLLHNAARALNLPARSPHSYLTLFDQRPNVSTRLVSSPSISSDADVPSLDEKYTGHILVSGYQVSFVLPSELPPLSKLGGRSDSGGDYTPLPTKLRGRRNSVSEKSVLLFVAGISMVVPYLTHPQRAPWLLSIPTPRCLSNTLKLRIFPPESTAASSFQSLSSGEGDSDSPSWDMTADPHVTRMANSRRSAYHYQHFADDESSDSASAPGFSDGFGIQGTFPSTERIRVRWATPVRNFEGGTREGRRRVGVVDVRGEMVCTILGRGHDKIRGEEGVLVHLDYNGTCQGIWYPGVATLLGMDVGLEARGCDVSWAPGHESGWDVQGGPGYTGHDIGGAERGLTGKQKSFDMPTLTVSSNLPTSAALNGQTPSRQSSISSTSSLLRAPLPPQNIPEYSFESAPTTPGSETGLSSVFYTTTDNDTREPTRASSLDQPVPDVPLPSLPITLHLNINDFLPPNKNTFTFSLKGTVLVTPRVSTSPAPREDSPHTSDADDESRGLLISLPRFRVLAADSEKIETTACNNTDAPAEVLDVYQSSDPRARKTEVTRGARSRVSSHGGRIALRALPLSRGLTSSPLATRRDVPETPSRSTNRSCTPDARRISSSSALRESLHTALKPIRDGPLMIPYVNATVTPISSRGAEVPRSYAVCVRLPAPADVDGDWLDFGLGHVSSSQSVEKSQDGGSGPVRVQIVSASLDDVPVRFETTAVAKTEPSASSALVFEQMSGKEWETWVRVRTGASRGGLVEVTYIVQERGESAKKGKGKERARDGSGLDIILPAFSIPVGRLQVDIETPLGFEIASLRSNLAYKQTSGGHHKLRHFGLEEFFYSQTRVHIVPHRPSFGTPLWLSASSSILRVAAFIVPAFFSAVLLVFLLSMHNDLGRLRTSLDRCGASGPSWAGTAPSVTVTATVVSYSTSTSTSATPDSTPLAPAEGPASSTLTSVTMIDITSPPSDTRDRDRGRPRSGDTSAHGEHNALLPVQGLPFPWPIQFELPFTREVAIEAVNHGLGIAWEFLRRLYHYPLDPP
ncbi:hypothetical protein EDB87DRAFT_1618001 [Lactarius vividus]|nr:hypothetical protein EDB87DRAFT_1618001 [Lactarius vividus]